MAGAIEAVDLTRRFGRCEAVNALTLDVPAGSVFALIGPNGAGKTTAIKLLMNLLRPLRGTSRLLGVESRRLGVRELQRIGYVSENQELPDWMTPDQLLEYCRPCYPTWDRTLVGRLQEVLGLTARTPLRTLSRGTRMKAALLASLGYRPELVILDEPFTGLDPLVRDELIRALLDTWGDRTCTCLISSHDIEDVERLADWVGFLDRDKLLFAEPIASLLARFRLVEIIGFDPQQTPRADDRRWLDKGVAGRTLRFIDTDHAAPDAEARIAAAFPSSEIRVSPMPLRDIFIALARSTATSAGTP